jgi:hypothetical protein
VVEQILAVGLRLAGSIRFLARFTPALVMSPLATITADRQPSFRAGFGDDPHDRAVDRGIACVVWSLSQSIVPWCGLPLTTQSGELWRSWCGS